ncbi:hypothetical protein GOODEAATRI_005994 [Goodea atripinnis]|uniref:Uncharacterized protein n=1 Tax=Goodea atripinnis TaxID=208336 RepID=A0ABV0MYZ8_9TELE
MLLQLIFTLSRPGNIFLLCYCGLYRWSSAAVDLLLQYSTCSELVLFDLLFELLFPNLSAHHVMISDISKTFLSTQLPLSGYFLIYKLFPVSLGDGCGRKTQYISSF